MRISYALLLCIPIGFIFFFIGRVTSRLVIGCYEQFERRASIAFGVFGALLIPDLWAIGSLKEEFPNVPGMETGFPLLLTLEGLILAAVFQLLRKSRVDQAVTNEKVEP
jgi:hypothetical protein